MTSILRFACGAVLVICLAGCAIPQGPYDDTYSAFGGRWQRLDPANNRVGSAFVDAGTRVADASTSPGNAATEHDLYPELGMPGPAQN